MVKEILKNVAKQTALIGVGALAMAATEKAARAAFEYAKKKFLPPKA